MLTWTKYTQNGQEWEVSESLWGYFNGVACKQLDLVGDAETFFGNDTIILGSKMLGPGIVRYYVTTNHHGLAESNAELARLYNHFNERG